MILRLWLGPAPLIEWMYLCEACGARRGWSGSQLVPPVEGDCVDCGECQSVLDAFYGVTRTREERDTMNQPNQGPARNGFFVEGAVARQPNQGPNFCHATLCESGNRYWDVSCFDDGPLPGFRMLGAGDVIRVEGRMQKRKMKADQMGPERWETQLVAMVLTVISKVQAQPQAQYQPPPLQAWANPQQPLAGYANPANQQASSAQQNYGAARPDETDFKGQDQQARGYPPSWGRR